jgi:hypothetical protein
MIKSVLVYNKLNCGKTTAVTHIVIVNFPMVLEGFISSRSEEKRNIEEI